MNLLFWALTVGVIGKILLAVGVLMAHNALAHEHRIDAKVIRTFHTEYIITFIGIALIVIGYVMEIFFYDFIHFLSCDIEICGALLNAS